MTKQEISSRTSILPEGYENFLRELKDRIRQAQLRTAIAVNHELVLLYWRIGRDILDRQDQAGWGTKIIDQLSMDLRRDFPDVSGFSPRNLKYMRAFAEAWPKEAIVQEPLAQITWYHNLALLEKVKSPAERLWYAQQAIEYGWSRNILVLQIESGLYRRQGKAQTNLTATLPPLQSDLAQQLLKDPYNFDFLTLTKDAREKEIESGLLDHMRKFLVELGVGFAFVGSQYPLEVGGEDFRIDLLFYHLKLRCFVVIELKNGTFKPEYAGKMNFYLSAADDLLRHADDKRSIGLILCKSKNTAVAEYALRDTAKPIGVSQYHITEALPEDLQGTLPTIEQLEAEMIKSDATSATSNEAEESA